MKTALVTGATKGIGRELVKQLCELGFKVSSAEGYHTHVPMEVDQALSRAGVCHRAGGSRAGHATAGDGLPGQSVFLGGSRGRGGALCCGSAGFGPRGCAGQ